jgi:integrase
MAFLLRRHNRYSARVRVPVEHRDRHDGKEFLQRSLGTSELKIAKAEAAAWEAALRKEWTTPSNGAEPTSGNLRVTYERLRDKAERGAFIATPQPAHEYDLDTPELSGIRHEIERIAEIDEAQGLTPDEEAQLWALQDAQRTILGDPLPLRRELEPSFLELSADRMRLWKTQASLKETNTEQQKEATFRLFSGFFKNRPIRGVRKKDAAGFVDALRQMDPLWARSPKAKQMTWTELQKTFGGRSRGLSDATINRHMATLKELWAWAQERDFCGGNNPFSGFHKKLREGVNVNGYQAWEADELNRLFNPPPKRPELSELMLVGMYTGMRLDEIASLTWGQIRKAEGVDYIQVEDAKTPAGNRKVPLHSALGWLKDRAESKKPEVRIWPTFNEEGPGKKPGADAGKEFSRLKQARGFDSRCKVFHSFRNNVVAQLEEHGVPINDIAQIVGHEKTFTSKKYNKAGVSLRKLSRAIARLSYPDVAATVKA